MGFRRRWVWVLKNEDRSSKIEDRRPKIEDRRSSTPFPEAEAKRRRRIEEAKRYEEAKKRRSEDRSEGEEAKKRRYTKNRRSQDRSQCEEAKNRRSEDLDTPVPKMVPRGPPDGAKNVKQLPKWSPKLSTWPQLVTKWPRWGPHGQHGARIPIFLDLDPPGIRKNCPFWLPKWSNNQSKNATNNSIVFRSGFGRDVLPFCSQNGTNFEPRRHLNRYQNGCLSQKRRIVLIRENKRFRMETGGSGLPFSRPKRPRIDQKTELDFEIGFWSILYRF